MKTGYFIPSTHHIVETEIKRSQFITYIGHASSRLEAEAFIKQLRQEHSQATHVCWAYIAGTPDTTVTSMSDDGEPSGTAGRPMLNALQHSGLGEIVAAVVRYFGGTKLGTGGLQRAYSGCVKEAITTLPTHEKKPQIILDFQIDYSHEALVRYLVTKYQAQLTKCEYEQLITTQIIVNVDQSELLKHDLINATAGQIVGLTKKIP